MTSRLEIPAPLIEGAAIGEIHIARLGLSEVIGQGESAAVLRRGVGHLADTAWLGERGNVVLAGHRDTVFRSLRDIQPGDRIDVLAAHALVHYEVQSTVVVSPATLSVLEPSEGNTLTLITCFPFGFIGAAPERFVVRAREIR
jgi:sortase A